LTFLKIQEIQDTFAKIQDFTGQAKKYRTLQEKQDRYDHCNIWKTKQISYKTKLNILKTCVFSTVLYACESWTIKKTDQAKILAFEMYCYRRILH